MARAAIEVLNGISAGHSSDDPIDIGTILQQSPLPDAVRSAPITYSSERLIDEALIDSVTACPEDMIDNEQYLQQLSVRRAALSRFKGRRLLCAVVRLPGVLYTLEIDPIDHVVVHWEWQAS